MHTRRRILSVTCRRTLASFRSLDINTPFRFSFLYFFPTASDGDNHAAWRCKWTQQQLPGRGIRFNVAWRGERESGRQGEGERERVTESAPRRCQPLAPYTFITVAVLNTKYALALLLLLLNDARNQRHPINGARHSRRDSGGRRHGYFLSIKPSADSGSIRKLRCAYFVRRRRQRR